MTERRLHAMDGVRGFAMLFVIVVHGLISFMETPIGWAARDRSSAVAADVIVWLGHAFLMPVFFLVAGYFARPALNTHGAAGFARRRARRVLVPLLVFLVPNSLALDALWDWGKRETGQLAVAEKLPELEGSGHLLTLGHLWFLYYLLFVSVAVPVVVLAWRRLAPRPSPPRPSPPRDVIARILGAVAGWQPLVLAVPITALLWSVDKLRIDTPLGFRVDPVVTAYYGVFFAWGWLINAHRDALADLGRHHVRSLLLAIAAFAAVIPALVASTDPTAPASPPAWALVASAVLICASTTAFVGVFVARTPGPRAWIRLLAASSYWCYIVHFPVIVLCQIVVADLALPGPIKFVAVMAATLAVCTVSYAAIRNTFAARYVG